MLLLIGAWQLGSLLCAIAAPVFGLYAYTRVCGGGGVDVCGDGGLGTMKAAVVMSWVMLALLVLVGVSIFGYVVPCECAHTNSNLYLKPYDHNPNPTTITLTLIPTLFDSHPFSLILILTNPNPNPDPQPNQLRIATAKDALPYQAAVRGVFRPGAGSGKHRSSS